MQFTVTTAAGLPLQITLICETMGPVSVSSRFLSVARSLMLAAKAVS